MRKYYALKLVKIKLNKVKVKRIIFPSQGKLGYFGQLNMCNIVNSGNPRKAVIKPRVCCQFVVAIESTISYQPGNIQTANERLVKGFARGEVNSYPLQDPIKNIICSPE
jgi:hypothetical protein